ncbi:MAG TPA: phosphoribosylamine--glycine ligase [Candidatus Acidoferrales bacterium]|nr:phosphoribosylamine--glycine ligase [Candidatus Acidoferrales bacterium]
MKVLVIGKGGREHALVWRLHQSQTVWKIFCATGNPGINQIAEPVPIAQTDFPALIDFAKSKSVDLTVDGPDDPLAAGIVDAFTRAGLKIFGPTAAAAQLESSKSFAKTVMREAGVPTADFAVFDDADSARSYVSARKGSMVVKADGLALGKGVVICPDSKAALAAINDAMDARKFGAAGNRVVIEEFLTGEELSFFALCDGENAIALGTAQDHKQVFDGDRGPNTGGMGAYSPVPQFGPEVDERIMREIVRPVLRAMSARGTPFRGALFVGLMIDGDRMNVIEFNARFGDPECEPLMMRFDGDLAETLLAVAEGDAARANVRLSPRSAAAVVLASGGYPGEYRKGIPITGLDRIEGNVPSDIKIKWAMEKIRVKVFHAGTALRDDGQLVTDGGRVVTVTAMAPELATAVGAAYQAAEMIEFEGRHFRRDIAQRALSRASGRRVAPV